MPLGIINVETTKHKAMKTTSKIIAMILGVLIATKGIAEKPESTMFYLNTRNYYQTSFTMASHLIILPFCINGLDSINMIFDTGVGRTIITEITNPYIVSLNRARQVKVKGLGTSESVDGVISQDNDLSMGKIHGKSQEVLVVPNKVIDLSTRTGHPINGIIGRTIFEQFIVEINYAKQTIKFFNPEQYNRKIKKDEEIIPIELIDGRPFIKAQVTINGQEIPVNLLFDTGMSMALWLDPTTNANIKPSEVRRQEILGHGLNGTLTGDISRIEKFKIGKFEFNDVITAFPSPEAIQEATLNTDRNGSVGAEIFRRFNVTIDYRNKQIILRKNADYKKPFVYDMSGLEVEPIIAGLRFYKIASVGLDTPASDCGLLKNDELKYINGMLTQSMTIAQINDLLRSKEGNTIRMTVSRNGENIDVKFKLRKLL